MIIAQRLYIDSDSHSPIALVMQYYHRPASWLNCARFGINQFAQLNVRNHRTEIGLIFKSNQIKIKFISLKNSIHFKSEIIAVSRNSKANYR